MLNIFGRFCLGYFFLKLILGAGVFAYYHFSAGYALPWHIQIVLAAIIIMLVVVSINAKTAEGLIFAPLLYFVFLRFEISGLNTFQPELREGPLNLVFPGTSVVSVENIVSILFFSMVLYWNIRATKNKHLRKLSDLTKSVFVRRPKNRKSVE